MELITKAFLNEHKQLQKLSKQGQRLLLSVCLYNIINPIFAIFINAFLWRQTQDVMLVAIFNLTLYCLLPVGFYCNGQLLKHFSVKRLYFVGSVMRAVLIGLLMVLPSSNLLPIILFGMGYGFTSGIFFSNKNLLTIELTSHTNRIYFSSLDYISQTISNIIIPVAIGTFLVFGTNHLLYTPHQAYYVVAIIMVVISLLLSQVIKKIHIKTPDIANIALQGASRQWNFARGITGLIGLLTGVTLFLPILIVLNYIGKEDILGIVQSIAAVVSGVVMYFIARTINTKFRVQMIFLSIVLLLIGSVILAFSFNAYGIFIFIALLTISQQLLYAESNSLIFDLIDRENQAEDNKYKYVFDLELILNVGRITGIMFFFFYIKVFSLNFAMQFTPLFFAIALIAIILLTRAIVHPTLQESEQAYSLSPNS